MDVKMEFITRLKRGERMSDLCREYGIARKTGHKLRDRFDEAGVAGLLEKSRAPLHIPHRTPPEVARLFIAERKAHPTWGPKKIKDVLEERLGRSFPSASTIGLVLDKNGLVERRKRRGRFKPTPTNLRTPSAPNQVWCTDYKGQFRLGDGNYCYPLTVTDQFSRYILCCEGMAAISDESARDAFEGLFRTYGVPEAIRSDNGVPFASRGLAGLTRLSAYWLQLGIELERIQPAHPEQNGAHERMHRTLKRETARPARFNLLQQQERFDAFLEEFNKERPHEALGMKRPAQLYRKSPRAYPKVLPVLSYPTHDDVIRVSEGGLINFPGRRFLYLSAALSGQLIGIREQDDGRWLVSFANLDLGHVGLDRTFIPITSTPQEAN